jgi:hypothetical protein
MKTKPSIVRFTGKAQNFNENHTGDIFFRGEHPDTRSAKEFLKIIDQRFGTQTASDKWYPGKRGHKGGTNSRLIFCTTNGKIYESIKEAGQDLGIGTYNFAKHLRGDRMHSHIGGYRFKEIK